LPFPEPCPAIERARIRAVTRARLHLTFPRHLTSEPIVHHVGADFGLVVNIRRANLEEERGGWVIVEVEGDEERITAAIRWLAEQGMQVDRIDG
jgi:ABC-type methionine transport system ATPase subunit